MALYHQAQHWRFDRRLNNALSNENQSSYDFFRMIFAKILKSKLSNVALNSIELFSFIVSRTFCKRPSPTKKEKSFKKENNNSTYNFMTRKTVVNECLPMASIVFK